MTDIFRRMEKKYIITKKQYEKIQEIINEYMIEDSYGKSTICNIYFDSPNYDMISHSIEKPFFKEKVRLRSYNTPTEDSKVYLEIKRKYDGVVGKRRIEMQYKDFEKYFKNRSSLENENKQIKSELDYYFRQYSLKPAMYISYAREAYYQKDNPDFRITFDTNIVARDYDLKLSNNVGETELLEKNLYIMEVKTLGAIPMWLTRKLSSIGVVPGTFSKYGEAYEKLVLNHRKIVKEKPAIEARKEEVAIAIQRVPAMA